MRNLLLWFLSVSMYYGLSSAWHMQFSLRDVLKGNCRDVCPRMCKKSQNSLSSDYSCGFVCHNVCSSKIKKRRSKRSIDTSKVMHMTPLPSKMKFFDIDNDGVVNLFEFARALGHNPRKHHVVRAFKAADLDDDDKLDFFEFNNDVWVTDNDVTDDNYDFEIDDDVLKSEFDDDSSDESGSSDSGSDSSDSSDSSNSRGSSGDSSKGDSDDSDDSDNGKDSDSDNSNGTDESKDVGSGERGRKNRGRGRGGRWGGGFDSVDVDSGRDWNEVGGVSGLDMPEAGGDVMDKMADIGDKMTGGISAELGDGIGDALPDVDVATDIGDAVDGMADGVGDAVDNMKETIDMKDALENVGENMVDGMKDAADNLKDMAGGAVEAVADAAENLADGITDDRNMALAAIAASSGSNSPPPPPPINVAGDSFVQQIGGLASSTGSMRSQTSRVNIGTSNSNFGGERATNMAGNRAARWSRTSASSNALFPPKDLSKGQQRRVGQSQLQDDSMTTSFVRPRSTDSFGLFRSVAPIRVRVPAFRNFRMRNQK